MPICDMSVCLFPAGARWQVRAWSTLQGKSGCPGGVGRNMRKHGLPNGTSHKALKTCGVGGPDSNETSGAPPPPFPDSPLRETGRGGNGRSALGFFHEKERVTHDDLTFQV